MKKAIKIWWLLTIDSVQMLLTTRFGMLIFVFGKLLRLAVYLGFIYFLFSGTATIIGYSRYQILLFLTTFSLMGTMGQMFFREVYRFRAKIVSGNFDFDLIKPIHPLIRNLLGGFDLFDLITLPVFFIALFWVLSNLQFSPLQFLTYVLLFLNGLLILTAIHIGIVSLGIMASEVDHLIMMYRDFETMGRFPVDIYKEPLRQILTFVIPVGLMFSVPAKALLGLISLPIILIAPLIGIVFLYLSITFWNYSIRYYSSASS